jgi:hypothetical protein
MIIYSYLNDNPLNCSSQVLTCLAKVDNELNAADVCNGAVVLGGAPDCPCFFNNIFNNAKYETVRNGASNLTGNCVPGWTADGNSSPIADCNNGSWINEQGILCVENECPSLSDYQGASYPQTKQSLTKATGTCLTGYSSASSIERACDINGDWQDLPGYPCLRQQCPVEDVWSLTNEGETKTIPCAVGYSGNRTRTCTADSTIWQDDVAGNTTDCVRKQCSAEDPWSLTNEDEFDSLPCVFGYFGNRTRRCSTDSTSWLDSVDGDASGYIRKQCLADSGWITTNEGGHIARTCQEVYGVGNYTGAIVRSCPPDSNIWNPPNDFCQQFCHADEGWFQTNAGFDAVRTCV